MSLSSLKSLMQPHSSFQSEFEKEMQKCYEEASQFSEAGDDRNAAMKLSQAAVWKRLHKLSSPDKD